MFAKTFAPFAMHGIVVKVNNCALFDTDYVVLEMRPCRNSSQNKGMCVNMKHVAE